MANSSSPKWMPTVGGVLNMVAGVFGLLGSLALGILAVIFQTTQNDLVSSFDDPDVIPFLITVFWIGCAIIIIPSIISIIGGVFAIRRKQWGWALAGSICSVLCSTILGAVALVFIVMSKKEFAGQEQQAD